MLTQLHLSTSTDLPMMQWCSKSPPLPKLFCAFVSSRLDYCNHLYYGRTTSLAADTECCSQATHSTKKGAIEIYYYFYYHYCHKVSIIQKFSVGFWWQYALAEIEIPQTKIHFPSLQLWWACPPTSVFCSWLTGVEPNIIFCCCRSSFSKLDVLCTLRCFLAYHSDKVIIQVTDVSSN